MTSNRIKADARRLQAAEGLPYAEALRRVRTAPPPAPTPTPVCANRMHEHMGVFVEIAGTQQKVCPRCATPDIGPRVHAADDAALGAKILRRTREEYRGWHQVDWPYGPNIDLDSREALVAWASVHNLRESSTYRKCIHWLLGKHCPRSGWGSTGCDRRLPGGDHLTAWNQGAGRNPAVLVSQPYGLSDKGRDALLALTAPFPNLRVEIDERGGWYRHGTTFVGIWRTDLAV